MRTEFDRELEERLVRYTAIDSQSDEKSDSTPSTAIQLEMLRLLHAELSEMGAEDVTLTDYGAVLATIPATTVAASTIGFLAHVDTAPAYNATGVKPRVHRAWDGADIRYPDAPELALSAAALPYLATKVGHDIVTASGATLLGADDKAGVAIVMTAARHLSRPTRRSGEGSTSGCLPTLGWTSPIRSTRRGWARWNTRAFRRTQAS